MSDEELTVSLVLRDFGGDITLRQVALGHSPVVLIEPKEVEDDVIFEVDSTGLEQEELADILESIAKVLKEGKEKE